MDFIPLLTQSLILGLIVFVFIVMYSFFSNKFSKKKNNKKFENKGKVSSANRLLTEPDISKVNKVTKSENRYVILNDELKKIRSSNSKHKDEDLEK